MATEDAFGWVVGATPAVVGETTDDDMKANKAFELTSWNIGAFNGQTIGSATHGAGAGKGEYSALSCTTNVDGASMTLFQHALLGTHMPEMHVLVRRAGGADQKQIPWIQIKMLKVFISDINFSGGGGMISVAVSFNCGAMEIKYIPQLESGAPGTPVPAVWSKVTNKNELKVSK